MKYLKIFEEFSEWDPFDEESIFDDSFMKSEKVDIYDYTKDSLESIGFHKWTEMDSKNDILLIPKKYFSKLKDGTKIRSIDGREVIVGKHNIDYDSRSGYLGYGIIIDKLKK